MVFTTQRRPALNNNVVIISFISIRHIKKDDQYIHYLENHYCGTVSQKKNDTFKTNLFQCRRLLFIHFLNTSF